MWARGVKPRSQPFTWPGQKEVVVVGRPGLPCRQNDKTCCWVAAILFPYYPNREVR